MAWSEVYVGARGVIRIDVDQVYQVPEQNRSRIRVLCRVRLTSGGPSSDSTNNCKVSLSWGVNFGPRTFNFRNMYTSWVTAIDEEFDVWHEPNGQKTIGVTFNFGPTITQNLGRGGSVSTSLSLNPLKRKPGKTAITRAYYTDPKTVLLDWTPADPGGIGGIQGYVVRWWPNESPNDIRHIMVRSAAVGCYVAVSDSTKGYSFRVAAYNGIGQADWSDVRITNLSDIPTEPRNLNVGFSDPKTANVTFDQPTSIGALDFYEIQHASDKEFLTDFKSVKQKERTLAIPNLPPGRELYVRVRAANNYGVSRWTPAFYTTVPSGPSIKIGNTWRYTTMYVFTNGAWRPAIPYVNVRGEWRQTSG